MRGSTRRQGWRARDSNAVEVGPHVTASLELPGPCWDHSRVLRHLQGIQLHPPPSPKGRHRSGKVGVRALCSAGYTPTVPLGLLPWARYPVGGPHCLPTPSLGRLMWIQLPHHSFMSGAADECQIWAQPPSITALDGVVCNFLLSQRDQLPGPVLNKYFHPRSSVW